MCFCKRYDMESRKPWTLVISILSAIVVIGGLIMAILSVLFVTDQDDIWSADVGEIKDQAQEVKKLTFAALIIFSLIAIVTGSGGLCCPLDCIKDNCIRCGPVLYGIALFFTWIAFVATGAAITGVSTSAPEQI
jgi:hypothetical protein